jgi:hypothetical protein
VANPPKLVPPYFTTDVFLVGFFPEFFIRDDSRPPNSTDLSQAPINERLQFSLNLGAFKHIDRGLLHTCQHSVHIGELGEDEERDLGRKSGIVKIL